MKMTRKTRKSAANSESRLCDTLRGRCQRGRGERDTLKTLLINKEQDEN